MRGRVEKVDLETVGCDHKCPNCGEWCNCDLTDEENGEENIYNCSCDCRIFEIEEKNL